jgi:hypothetical protein
MKIVSDFEASLKRYPPITPSRACQTTAPSFIDQRPATLTLDGQAT